MSFKLGQRGNDVLALQKQINAANKGKAGYVPLVEDGIFGPKTDAAYKAYSVSNAPPAPAIKAPDITGLTGLRDYGAGKGLNIGWSKGTGVTVNGSPIDTSGLTLSGNKYYGTADQLNNLLAPYVAPVQPANPWEEKLNTAIDKYLNYNPNAPYDVTTDPQYAPLKSQYESLGQTAFNNNIGSLAALTGGRPSTAAVGTATGAKDEYLKEFESSVVPSLVNQEMNRRQNIAQNLFNQVQELQGLSKDEYGKYRDNVSDWKDNRDYNHQVSRDKVLDDQWMKNFDLETQQNLLDKAYKDKQISIDEYNARTARINATGGGASGNKNIDQQDINTLGTAQEVQNYTDLLDYFSNDTSRTDAEKYNFALTHAQNWLGNGSPKPLSKDLYNRLLSDLETVMKTNKSYGAPAINKDLKPYYDRAVAMSKEYDPANQSLRYTVDDILAYVNSLPLSPDEKDELANELGLPQ